jgi:hypothetical protein
MKKVICGLLIVTNTLLAESLLIKDPNWWKEFVQNNVPAKPAVPDPVIVPSLASPLENQEQPKSWFERNQESIVYCAAFLATGYCGYLLGKRWSNAAINTNRIKQLERQLKLAEEAEKMPVINDAVRQIVHLETKFNAQANEDLKAAVTGSDIITARRLVNQGRLAPLVQDFSEAHLILAAINADYQCTICLDPITNPNLFGTGSDNCFHFVCTTCKQRMANSDMSNRTLCPSCRHR